MNEKYYLDPFNVISKHQIIKFELFLEAFLTY